MQKTFSAERTVFSANDTETKGYSCFFSPYPQNRTVIHTLQHIKININHKPKIIKLLEENKGTNLYDFGVGRNFAKQRENV